MTTLSFLKGHEPCNKILRNVHYDLFAPFKMQFLIDAKYFMTFIDDSTSRTPERNNRAKMMNRTLLHMPRFLLLQSGLKVSSEKGVLSTMQERIPSLIT